MRDGLAEFRWTTPRSVWLTGQYAPLTQLRNSGCVPGTATDTDRIPPAVAAHAIAAYTDPGDLVLDPDCGAGTVLTEALRADRYALGLTADDRWWSLARANISAAKAAGAWRDGSVLDAWPEVLATTAAAGLVGRVGLVLASLRAARRPGLDRDAVSAVTDFAETMRCCAPLLRPGGHFSIVARPRRNPAGSLIDLTTPLTAAAVVAGLEPVERCIALSAGLRGHRLVTRASLAERRAATRVTAARTPTALTAHHEVLVFALARDAEPAAADVIDLPTAERGGLHVVSDAEQHAWQRAA